MNIRGWIRAARLPSQSYIALPLLLGQLLAWRATGRWDWSIFVLVQLFGLFDQLYIVFANDVADLETDRLNSTPTMFSGGSRVLVDGSLTPAALGNAAVAMVGLCGLVGAALWAGFDRPLALPLIAVGIALLWAYSFPPFRLSYRGGGEFLQMLGVGGVLPLIGWYGQAGALEGFPWELLVVLLPMHLAAAVCTALPDEPSDRGSGKRTIPVWLGPRPSRMLVVALYSVGLVAFVALYPTVRGLDAGFGPLVAVPTLALAITVAVSRGASAGTRRVSRLVFFGILTNLAFLAGLIIDLIPGG